ncbi:hypothetical protein CG747_10605 [Streptomyces sp. CB02959]|uniref:DUF6284 family protein n=1 Tax=Streptomyces sp. CB02959 TaxID=2020330 RepID=UPI000C27B2F4|nr:DUF6284 family protein [Streptomyces sp. CB02959]PJN40777.1 hypothetical protein CG747_10605 [Streptomyces sp. CB02959]
MKTIIAFTPDPDRQPTAAELDAIAAETPLIEAEVELLDVHIALLDRRATELDRRRLRRAENKVLAERLMLANRLNTPGEAA